jgi:hypothetical protein
MSALSPEQAAPFWQTAHEQAAIALSNHWARPYQGYSALTRLIKLAGLSLIDSDCLSSKYMLVSSSFLELCTTHLIVSTFT